MSAKTDGLPRAQTDASLRAERQNTDELARGSVADANWEQVLERACARADRLLDAARGDADARLPPTEQTKAAVALLLEQREAEDQAVSAERGETAELIQRKRRDQREKLAGLLMLERQTTDLHLALERTASDRAVATREEFLAQASHDLRGLVAAHKLYLALMVRQSGDSEHGRRLAPHLATLSQIGEQMERLIHDLVDVAAIEAGVLAVVTRPYPVAELLSTATSVFELAARERDQTLTVTPAPAGVRVVVDVARAVQVIGNLISNAIKFTPPGGKITVGSEATREEVTFFVADTGPGVPAEDAARIFERFARANHSTGGLGLACSFPSAWSKLRPGDCGSTAMLRGARCFVFRSGVLRPQRSERASQRRAELRASAKDLARSSDERPTRTSRPSRGRNNRSTLGSSAKLSPTPTPTNASKRSLKGKW